MFEFRGILDILTLAISALCVIFAALIVCADLVVLWLDDQSNSE